MNVFVLSTGRCGSKSFAKACAQISNYSSGHETRVTTIGKGRLNYPDDHIEVDNRLSWLLGRLEEKYGDDAFYVHLTRDPERVARSLNRRWHLRENIVRAYADQIHMTTVPNPLLVCQDYLQTVTANINSFLKNKSKVFRLDIDDAESDFPILWDRIGATGNISQALMEISNHHNKGAQIGIDY